MGITLVQQRWGPHFWTRLTAYARPGSYVNGRVTIFKGSFWLEGSDHTADPTGGSPRRNRRPLRTHG